MSFDEKAMTRAGAAHRSLATCGAIPLISSEVRSLWAVNVDRHDPAVGDTTRLLGFQSAENLNVRVQKLLRGDEEWAATGLSAATPNGSLLLTLDGMRFRFVKVGAEYGLTPDWQHGFSWENASQIRADAAEKNRLAYHPAHIEPGMEGLFPVDEIANEGDPAALKDFFIVWAGLNDEEHRTAGWLCVPSAGEPAVLAAIPIWFDEADGRGVSSSGMAGPAPEGDEEPHVPIALKKDIGRAGNGRV